MHTIKRWAFELDAMQWDKFSGPETNEYGSFIAGNLRAVSFFSSDQSSKMLLLASSRFCSQKFYPNQLVWVVEEWEDQGGGVEDPMY